MDLIENKNVNMFYVGNQGKFDAYARYVLRDLKKSHSCINYAVVLAYMPGERKEWDYEDYSDTVYPDDLENTPPKYAITKRNRWMIDKSRYVITYITHPWEARYSLKNLRKRKEKLLLILQIKSEI